MNIFNQIIQQIAILTPPLWKQRLKKTVATCFLFMLFFHSAAQHDLSSDLRSNFDAYRKQVLQEKLFVHTGKSVYLAGEILWFKIYDVDAFFHMPLSVSSIAYVELLDKNNRPMLQAKLALKKGDGYGSLYLPATLNSGNYKFRTYTNWMKNFSPDYFFEKSITILNTQKITDIDSTSKMLEDHVDFFPEGGNLVNGLSSKVAFKIADQYGKGVDGKGILTDNNGDTISRFRTLKFGMGSLIFTPLSQHSYNAIIELANGTQIIKQLPAAYDHGYVMHLGHNEKGQLEIKVNRSTDNSADTARSIFLFIHTRQSIKWVGSNSFQNGETIFHVDTSKLGEGISQLTIFDSDKIPVCERLYFSYPKNGLHLVINSDRSEYECRKKIDLSIFSGDMDENPRPADMSLAVYRIDSLQKTDEENIDNYLWLTSDLTGNIESPDYYFSNKSTETSEVIDDLMLTQGWRRFKWEDVLGNKKPAFTFSPEYNGHIVSGKIMETKNKLPGKEIDGFLAVPGTNTIFRNSTSDAQGHIKFELRNFYGSREIIVQTNPLQDSNYIVDISNPFIDQFTATPLPHFSMSKKDPKSLLYASINIQAQNLYRDNKLHEFMMAETDTSAFYIEPDEKYLLDNYTRFTTLEEVVREYVQGVNISKSEGKFFLSVIDESTKLKFNEGALLLIDGIPVFDVDKFIRSYDPLKIYKLEVVRRKYFLGYKSFDGIVNFTTYKGDLGGYELDPNAIVLDYQGLQLQRKFYSPQYKNDEQIASHLPDFRNLLYWEPALKTNKTGKLDLDFYASDIPGKYAVVLQGLDASGKTGSQVIYLEVKSRSK